MKTWTRTLVVGGGGEIAGLSDLLVALWVAGTLMQETPFVVERCEVVGPDRTAIEAAAEGATEMTGRQDARTRPVAALGERCAPPG